MYKRQSGDRAGCIFTLADLLINRQADILAANAKDLAEATKINTPKPLLSRLSLSHSKLKSLSAGNYLQYFYNIYKAICQYLF